VKPDGRVEFKSPADSDLAYPCRGYRLDALPTVTYNTSGCETGNLTSRRSVGPPTQTTIMHRVVLISCLVGGLPFICIAQNPVPTPVQDSAIFGRSYSNSQIADAIKNSGLTEAQIRARLLAAGFDPKLADPYFRTGANGEGGGAAAGANVPANPGFVTALEALGIIDTVSTGGGNQNTVEDTAQLTRGTAVRAPGMAGGVPLFGKTLFSGGTSEFDPVAAGPVDASYRLGVGDQLQLVITGDMEMAVALNVRRDGTVLVPQIGQVAVAGLTLEAARTSIKQRAVRVFNVIDEGRARVDLMVSRVRNNQVFVVGEVERPGSYQVNALGTVFRALAVAGGPSARGTFRNIELRRGGTVVSRVDIYDYLLRGDASNDVRTEQGDIIFVGLSKRLIVLQGAVRRPGIYELRDDEKFSRLLEFGGGLLPTAATDRVQIDRVLPPEERSPGKDRALIDIPIKGQPATLDTLKLYDNDVVMVFGVGEVRRNRVVVQGEVYEPGMYEWAPGMTLAQLVSKAQGLLPWALADRIKIQRQILHTGRAELYSLNPQDSSFEKVPLHEFDTVTVLDARRTFPSGTLAIGGAVVLPGQRAYVENMTLKDFIDLSGGFKPEAAVVELARKKLGARYSDTAAVVRTFPVLPGGRLDPEAAAVVLERDDRVNVRDFPGFRVAPRTVTLIGLFTYPGAYVLRSDAEKVSDVVRRASGLLPSAYPPGARLIREGRPVAIDLTRALRGDRDHDIYLTHGDRLEVGPNPSVVFVSGAVERQVIVPFHPGWGVAEYVSAAGGYSADADKNNIVVEYPSGEIHSRRKQFLLPTRDVSIISGSVITVGQKPPDKESNTGELLTRTVQVTTALVSLIIGYLSIARR